MQKSLLKIKTFLKLISLIKNSFPKEHPKTRLLFAHGGYSSFLEAAKTGIPILLVPLFADQGINAKRAQRFGICEILDKKTLNDKIVEELLRKMLNDDRYYRNARKLSVF
ncbi:unnamed protein product [Meloidogyne enterolobii]|uniref:Uncharacterized protein n=1 Tax=Meloidogyne enterolobii TaxID=390850 RepID=A0ACB0Y2I5_MELEN